MFKSKQRPPQRPVQIRRAVMGHDVEVVWNQEGREHVVLDRGVEVYRTDTYWFAQQEFDRIRAGV